MTKLKENATFLAALIAAATGIIIMLTEVTVGFSETKFSLSEELKQETLSFRRSQFDQLTNNIREAAILLHAQHDASQHVRWTKNNPETSLILDEYRYIERIRYGLNQLSAMGIITTNDSIEIRNLESLIVSNWQQYSSARSTYRDLIDTVNIKPSGEAISQEGLKAQENWENKEKAMLNHLKTLRTILANIQETMSTIPEGRRLNFR